MLLATTFSGPRSFFLAFSLTLEPTKRAAKRGARKHLKRPTRCAAEKGKAHVNQNAPQHNTDIIRDTNTTTQLRYYTRSTKLWTAEGRAQAKTQPVPEVANAALGPAHP